MMPAGVPAGDSNHSVRWKQGGSSARRSPASLGQQMHDLATPGDPQGISSNMTLAQAAVAWASPILQSTTPATFFLLSIPMTA